MLEVSFTNEADAHALKREEGQHDVSRSQEAKQGTESQAGLGGQHQCQAESRLCYRKPQNSAQTQTELVGLENVLSF